MISLAPIKDTQKIKSFFEQNGLLFDQYSGCVTAIEKDDILGFCLYSLDDQKMIIQKIVPDNDLMLADGILRSTLHVAAERSIINAYYTNETEQISRKLAFIKDSEEKKLDIDKLFQSCHNCG